MIKVGDDRGVASAMATGHLMRERVGPWAVRRTVSLLLRCALGTGLLAGIMATWLCAQFGSVRQGIAYYARGQTLSLDSTAKSFGLARPDEVVFVTFKLTNRGSSNVRVVGCYVYCNCAAPKDLPFALAPGETRDFTVSIRAPSAQSLKVKGSGDLELPLTLFTNIASQSRIQLSIFGQVRDEPPSPNIGS
jgi:hypothetical protein